MPTRHAPSLQCLALLVSNCPYHRLSRGYLSRILAAVRGFADHRGGCGLPPSPITPSSLSPPPPIIPSPHHPLPRQTRTCRWPA